MPEVPWAGCPGRGVLAVSHVGDLCVAVRTASITTVRDKEPRKDVGAHRPDPATAARDGAGRSQPFVKANDDAH